MKISNYFILFIALVPFTFQVSAATPTPTGGIQLIMTKENQKTIERHLDYLSKDLDALHYVLDKTLYTYTSKRRFFRKVSVRNFRPTKEIEQISKADLEKISMRLVDNYKVVLKAFDEVYFNHASDTIVIKEELAPIVDYCKQLEKLTDTDFQDVNFLVDWHKETGEIRSYSKRRIPMLYISVETLTMDEIKKRFKEMTLWSLIFGY